MNIGIIAVIIFAVFIFSVVFQVAVDAISLVVNGFIIYILGLRSFKEVKEGQHHLYLLCGFLSLFVILAGGNIIKFLWPFTTFMILLSIFVIVVQYVKDRYGL